MRKLYVERNAVGEWGPDCIHEFRKATGCKRRGLSVALCDKITENLYRVQIGYSCHGAISLFPAMLVDIQLTKREEDIRENGSYCPRCGWISTHHLVCELCGKRMNPQIGDWQSRTGKGRGGR